MALAFLMPVGRAIRRLRGDDLAAHLAKGAIGAGGLGLANKAFSLVGALVLGRSLGSQGYGYYTFALAMVGFFAVPVQLGLPQLIIREVATSYARSEWSELRGLRRWVTKIAAALTFFGAVFAGGASLLLADHIAALDRLTFAIAMLLMPLQVGLAMITSMLSGLRRVVQGAWPASLLQPALFVLLLLLLARGLTSDQAVLLNILATAAGFGAALWLLRKYWPREAKAAAPRYRTGDWTRSMLPFTLLAGISILNQRVDILMLGALTSASDVGIYNMAAQGAILVSFPLMACNAVLGPNIARLHTQNDHSRMQRLFTLSTLVISVAAAVAALVLVVGGGWFLANLFGEAFVDAYPALVILSIGQLFNAWVGSVGLFLSMTGNEKDTLKGLVSSAILSVVLNAILIPPFGIVGAAISMTLGSVTWNVILAILLYRRLGIFAGPIGGWLSKRKNAPGEP